MSKKRKIMFKHNLYYIAFYMVDKRLTHNKPSCQCEVLFNARDTKPDYVPQKLNKDVPL